VITRDSVIIFALSAITGLAIHAFCLYLYGGSLLLAALDPPIPTDIQDDGSIYYGRPLVTVGVLPFSVSTREILNQFEVSIGSWLRASAQIIVHMYDVVGGMGPLSPHLVSSLQQEFGAERVMIRGKIIKKLRIETLPEAFEAIEGHVETEFAGWFSNDMILPANWMDFVYAARRYFGAYHNYSMHFARRDLFFSCRPDISLQDVVLPTWIRFFEGFRTRCRSRLHPLGYDCYLWNHLGINMTAAKLEPFFIGRPDFDGAIISRQMQQGWFVTAYPAVETYHLEHPDRLQYIKKKRHPDSLHNRRLFEALGRKEWRNEHIDIRLSLEGIGQRRNGTWLWWDLERPLGTFPFDYPHNWTGANAM
jgi:hypothetical protein